MDEQKNDSEDLVAEHLENAKQIADEEAKGDSENSNDSDQKADLEFEEAKASLDDVFEGVILENTKKELISQKEKNQKLF